MTAAEIEKLISTTLTAHQHNPPNKDFGMVSEWKFKSLPSHNNSMGVCWWYNKTILINIKHPLHVNDSVLIDTVLHECAHALAGVYTTINGSIILHGRVWRQVAIKLGAIPKATHSFKL